MRRAFDRRDGRATARSPSGEPVCGARGENGVGDGRSTSRLPDDRRLRARARRTRRESDRRHVRERQSRSRVPGDRNGCDRLDVRSRNGGNTDAGLADGLPRRARPRGGTGAPRGGGAHRVRGRADPDGRTRLGEAAGAGESREPRRRRRIGSGRGLRSAGRSAARRGQRAGNRANRRAGQVGKRRIGTAARPSRRARLAGGGDGAGGRGAFASRPGRGRLRTVGRSRASDRRAASLRHGDRGRRPPRRRARRGTRSSRRAERARKGSVAPRGRSGRGGVHRLSGFAARSGSGRPGGRSVRARRRTRAVGPRGGLAAPACGRGRRLPGIDSGRRAGDRRSEPRPPGGHGHPARRDRGGPVARGSKIGAASRCFGGPEPGRHGRRTGPARRTLRGRARTVGGRAVFAAEPERRIPPGRSGRARIRPIARSEPVDRAEVGLRFRGARKRQGGRRQRTGPAGHGRTPARPAARPKSRPTRAAATRSRKMRGPSGTGPKRRSAHRRRAASEPEAPGGPRISREFRSSEGAATGPDRPGGRPCRARRERARRPNGCPARERAWQRAGKSGGRRKQAERATAAVALDGRLALRPRAAARGRPG